MATTPTPITPVFSANQAAESAKLPPTAPLASPWPLLMLMAHAHAQPKPTSPYPPMESGIVPPAEPTVRLVLTLSPVPPAKLHTPRLLITDVSVLLGTTLTQLAETVSPAQLVVTNAPQPPLARAVLLLSSSRDPPVRSAATMASPPLDQSAKAALQDASSAPKTSSATIVLMDSTCTRANATQSAPLEPSEPMKEETGSALPAIPLAKPA